MLPLLLLLLTSTQALSYQHTKQSAATPSQVKFAIENKYDDTGPGAKGPEYAYHTYKNLDDALVAYLDDPDTKLPHHERAKAIANLYRSDNFNHIEPVVPKRVDAFTGNRPKVVPIVLSTYNKFDPDPNGILSGFDLKAINNGDLKKDPFKWQKEQAVKASRLSISHYNKDEETPYKPHPLASFVYNLHNPHSGDMKSQEIKDGSGAVHGYYTVMEADGRRRTVHYQADPQRGFKASVQRVYHQ